MSNVPGMREDLQKFQNPKTLVYELLQEITDPATGMSFITFDDTKDCYVYNGKGIYLNTGETHIEQQVQAKIGAKATTYIVNETINMIKRKTYVPRDAQYIDPAMICVKNGVLDIEKRKLHEHTPELWFFSQLPVKYDPDATSPEIEQFLSQIVRKDDINILQEFVGYCLQQDYRYQVSIMLLGGGANGKSTFLNLLKTLLGPHNVSGISLQQLTTQRFLVAQLYNKLANIYPDLPDTALYNTGVYKALTGGDPITADIKFSRNPITFVNTAKLIFSANKLPKVEDQSDAFYRRWIIITFPNQFLGSNADPNLLEKLITPEEISGFLNWALDGLDRLNKQKQFSYSKTVDEIREDYIRKSNPIEAFCLDRLEADHRAEITKDEVFKAYIEYCNENKLPTTAKNIFARDLPRYMPTVITVRHKVEGKQVYFWQGIRFKTDEDKKNENRQQVLG